MEDQISSLTWDVAIKRCRTFLDTVGVQLGGRSILLAVSGGVDSMCMLELLCATNARISVAHVNYGLRGAESDGDTMLVREACAEKSLVLHEKTFDLKSRIDTGEESLQQLGRRLRYTWFEELRVTYQYVYICTAHHQDDSAESFFINLLRGTGLKGLKGIPVIRGHLVRPMLCFTRAEIRQLGQHRQIRYREDSSNFGRDYLRNRIRHDIIPLFKAEQANFISRMHATQQRLHEEYALMEDYLIKLKTELCSDDNGTLVIDLEQLLATTSPAIVLLSVIQQYGFSWTQCKSIIERMQTSGATYLSHTHRLIVDRNKICVVPSIQVHDEESIQLDGDGKYVLPDGELHMRHENALNFTDDPHREYVDSAKLTGALTVRHWKTGDYFYPLGGPGRQKLQDYFTNQKISILDKEQVWLLTAGDDIIWVIGMRLDERFRITSETKDIMLLEWKSKED